MKKFYYLYNGRSSLNFILSNLNLKKKDEILYPNFSCDVIFQYSKNKKYTKKFYDIKKNFFFKIKSIKKSLSKNTKVIIIINFFGIKQNTKNLYKFCKKRNIHLIIDDCHTFYNLNKNINNNSDTKFFSPSKIFKHLNTGGILQINNNKIKINKPKTRSYNFNYKFLLKEKIKKTNIYSKLKFMHKRPKFENPNFFKSEYKIKNFLLDKKSIEFINRLNVKKEIINRSKNFKFWKKVCKNLKIKSLLKYNNVKHGAPLFFPAICENSEEAVKIYDLGWKNYIEITSWPTLHKSQRNNKELLNYWKKLVFFPMDNNYYKRKEILKWKKI